MTQRHPNDSTITLDPGHADPTSPLFVPIHLRDAFAGIDADTVEKIKKSLYTEVSEPLYRTVGGQHVVINHRSSDDDFNIALCWLKVDEAKRIVARDTERIENENRTVRDHTCRCCGRIDATAQSGPLSGVGIPGAWCEQCRQEWDRQGTLEHAAFKVGTKTVEQVVATARKQARP